MRKPNRLRIALPFILLLLPAMAAAFVPTVLEECELANEAICRFTNVETHQGWACPPGAETIRPLGTRDCARVAREAAESERQAVEARAQARDAAVAEGAAREAASAIPPPRPSPRAGNPASVPHAMEWSLLLVVVVLMALAWRRRRGLPAASPSPLPDARPAPAASRDRPGGGLRSAGVLLVSALPAFLLARAGAAQVFQRIFGHYDNHDSIAPWLLAAPAALLAFLLVFGIAMAVLALLAEQLWPVAGRRP